MPGYLIKEAYPIRIWHKNFPYKLFTMESFYAVVALYVS